MSRLDLSRPAWFRFGTDTALTRPPARTPELHVTTKHVVAGSINRFFPSSLRLYQCFFLRYMYRG